MPDDAELLRRNHVSDQQDQIPPAGRPPRISDAAYRDITGQPLDFTQPGPWTLTGWDHGASMDITTTHEGPLAGSAPAQLAAAYPRVRVWRVAPARIDETYRFPDRAAGRLVALLGIDWRVARAILTIAATEELGMRFAYGRFEVTGHDDEQSWRIRTIEPQEMTRQEAKRIQPPPGITEQDMYAELAAERAKTRAMLGALPKPTV